MLSPGILPTRAGVRSSLSITDINSDGVMDFFVGNARGGVNHYSGTTPTDTTIIDTTGITSRPRQQNEFHFDLYPNPSSNHILLRFTESKQAIRVEIVTTLGQSVHRSKHHNSTSIKLNSKQFPPGLYFVKLLTNDNLVGLKSFVKN